MSELVLKWAWRHGALTVDLFDSLDEALSSAKYAADNGDESLDCIEVVSPTERRVLPREEVDELLEPMHQAEMERYKAQPPIVAVVDVLSPSGSSAMLDSFVSLPEAETEAARLRPLLGDVRVQVRNVKGRL